MLMTGRGFLLFGSTLLGENCLSASSAKRVRLINSLGSMCVFLGAGAVPCVFDVVSPDCLVDVWCFVHKYAALCCVGVYSRFMLGLGKLEGFRLGSN